MLNPRPRSPVAGWCEELDRRLAAGEPARAEDYLVPELDAEDAVELVYAEFVCLEQLGRGPDPNEYLIRFPGIRTQLEEQFLVHRAVWGESKTPPAIGPYDLLREIGRGARGAVFAARDRRDGRTVAIKLLLTGEYSTADDLALFQHEAAVLARLDHPNLTRIYEAGLADGRPYLALEYIDGPPLSRALGTFRPPVAAAALVETLARAVHHAHLQGVVHRDLKPGNILLQLGGTQGAAVGTSPPDDPNPLLAATPKVSDFGLARVLDASNHRTRTGHIVGTLAYMAPEQAAGTAHRAGPAADVYALGAVLYELLTGHAPFGPDPSPATLHRILYEPPAGLRRLTPAVPRDLETVVLKCLEKNPDRRYATALVLADDLRRFLAGRPIAAQRVGPAESLRRWVARRPAPAALIAVVVLATVGSIAGGLYYNARLRSALEESEDLQRQTAAALAETDALRADTRRQLDDTRRVLFAHQLAQLPALWLREPIRARQLLVDEKICPPELRDFTWHYFQNQCALGERSYEAAHPGGTRAVAFLPDGRLVSGGADGKLRYWPAPTSNGRPGRAVAAHGKPVTGVAACDDRTVASSSLDRTVKVWTLDHPKPVRTITVPAVVNGLSADRQNHRLAGACGDGVVRVWDRETGREVAALAAPQVPVTSVAFGDEGRLVAAGAKDGSVRLWDLATRTAKVVGTEHTGAVVGLAFAPDGTFVVSTTERGEARVNDLRTGAARDLRGHLMPVRGAVVSPDNERILTGGEDTYLKVWDTATGQELTNLMRRDVSAAAWSPDGRWVAAGSRDGRLCVYRLPTFPAPAVHRQPTNVGALAALPGGGIVTADRVGEVRVWGAAVPTPVATFEVRPHDSGPVRPQAVLGGGAPALAISPDGATIAIGAGGGEVVLWDAARRTETGRWAAHDGNVAAVAYHPGGQIIATGGVDTAIRLWDVETRKPVRTLAGHTRGILSLAWSPDGTRLASGSEDNTVRVWDAETGRLERELKGHTMWVLSVAFRPDGRLLASGSRDRTVRLWDLVGSQPPVVLSGYTNWVYSVEFSPDGRTMATGSGHYSIDTPGEVKLCDPDAGYVRAILTNVHAPVAFSRDGTRLHVGVRGGVAELVGATSSPGPRP
ncbi:wd-40 repeat-containing protein : Serine/threonine protein kinase with WD40 repeats OS=Pirellula staleyi (strain ATCC 27377 / DSM 6068 / ICPB 4128) GN=Psta_3332 PE=4 SV=1: Pkinase: WD40: WD40: WD40: WD40: WD40: WD40: WD40: WD40: WD40: WD40 [Gemmataceae bacterium]|nr:wd-40 repeat-containing protein : Serine/threonine protein kinase with WD40 repeats OS=Pirellula staleyi (strain ATCC 27377 / DSM 6068 / ICPB 4128) GN=Psta_3332 PE=4 SV=1: Pkinase: WD40: WD40: WD40: WD40: WD40: WD40: WD40: WD40: WD40: WD40 [Gemmataceae bacterium]VTU02616.1 wd-40 repeat-containing protein : Serine/threonine protein kinase with WD40 repeats OS=Pirellula staleyi (strain ATCC 27377 / DSM 6068 / ICPB 4128) GN=Psta_3332 PE=4 SV=1: Pkinase: WD40: WD40: WD40: WD40: WD40: WD40: WD40: WD